jgi:hypothetical protein
LSTHAAEAGIDQGAEFGGPLGATNRTDKSDRQIGQL